MISFDKNTKKYVATNKFRFDELESFLPIEATIAKAELPEFKTRYYVICDGYLWATSEFMQHMDYMFDPATRRWLNGGNFDEWDFHRTMSGNHS